MPILVDYSQVAIAGIMQFQSDMERGSDEKIVDLIRHVVLNSLLSNKVKFAPSFGDMIICTDGRQYWRKDHFPYYKASRKAKRDDSKLNWKLIFDTLSSLRQDLETHFPYRVVHNNRAEADDIIGVLAKYFATNELRDVGLEQEPQRVLILSSDRDNVQLQKYKNVSQWSPMQKKAVKPDTTAHNALMEKICTGDSGDGVPNIVSADNVFVEGIRQKPFRKARLQEFYEKGIGACQTDDERRNFQRNELLVSYDKIPQDLADEIINTYKASQPRGNQRTVKDYLVANRCRNLMSSIEDF